MDNQTGKTAGDTITVTPYEVSGCNSDCSYSVSVQDRTLSPAQESSTYNGTAVSFVDAGASGTENYTLTISRGLESHSCTFSVTYSTGEESSSSEAEASSSASMPTVALTNTENNSGGPLTTGSYKVTAIASCSKVRFNCEYNFTNTGCSIGVNANTAVSGEMNSSNNILSPKPVVGDVLTVTGTVTNIWCAGW